MARSNDNLIHLTNDYHVRDLSGLRTPLLSHHLRLNSIMFIISSISYCFHMDIVKIRNISISANTYNYGSR